VPKYADRPAEFIAATPHPRDEVFAEPCPVPDGPGVYGWWFREIPADIDVSHCQQRDGLTLLYVGISPTRPPVDGKPTQGIRKRVRYHFGGGNADSDGSTLRRTLGILLGYKLRRIGTGKRRTFAGDEARLTQWMADNAAVSWLEHPEPWLVEDKMLAAFDLPLNGQEANRDNAFYPELKRLRTAAMKSADKQRVLKEW
jgi:hypothetical protein